MRFDDFVNKILREATFSTIPKEEKENPTTMPKDGLASITGVSTKGTPVTQSQTPQQGQVTPQPQNTTEDISTDDESASDEAIKGLADAIEKGNKQQEDFYKKMIATLTAQKAQTTPASQTLTTNPVTLPSTNIPNPQ